MGLRTTCSLGLGRGNPSKEGGTLLGVGEVLQLEDLKFPVLLDESEDTERIIVELGAIDGCAHASDLRRGWVI